MDLSLLGGRIKAERKNCGFTLETLAEKADISRNYLWEIEAGRKAPALGTLYSIGLVLNTSIDFLLGISAEKRLLSADRPVTWRDKSVEQIVSVLNGLGDSELALVSDMISDFSKYLARK